MTTGVCMLWVLVELFRVLHFLRVLLVLQESGSMCMMSQRACVWVLDLSSSHWLIVVFNPISICMVKILFQMSLCTTVSVCLPACLPDLSHTCTHTLHLKKLKCNLKLCIFLCICLYQCSFRVFFSLSLWWSLQFKLTHSFFTTQNCSVI